MRKLKRAIQDRLLAFSARGMDRCAGLLDTAYPSSRWFSFIVWMDGWFLTLFVRVYEGSSAEMRLALRWADDPDIEDFILTPLQLEVRRRRSEWIDCEEVE